MLEIIRGGLEQKESVAWSRHCSEDRSWPDIFSKSPRSLLKGMDTAFYQNGFARDLPRKPLKECVFTVKESGLVLSHETSRKKSCSNNGTGGCGMASTKNKNKSARFGKQEAKRNRRTGWEEVWSVGVAPVSTVAASTSPSSPSSCSTVILRVTPPGSPSAAAGSNGAISCPASDIHYHLQSMLYLVRPEDTLKMAIKLETTNEGRTRYLAVVFWKEECVLLGVDCRLTQTASIGLCLKLLANTSINLDGDGGFSVSTAGKQHIFKPVSVQALWSALQTLHRACDVARSRNFFGGAGSHEWTKHYEGPDVRSDCSCVNQWNAMADLESRRPPSPDSVLFRCRPDLAKKQETETMIRAKLREIMMSVDLDQVTSKSIRIRLEEEMDFDLADFKSFIDHEMLTILGQMDQATEIFPHLFLGSEWNASNLEELRRNRITHVLNVTREIDNFFPDLFDYNNVRVYDDEATQLLKHWDDTFKYIDKAREQQGKVLVHCKMGISRSASVVVAYTMKRNQWTLAQSQEFVQEKRACIKPNENFLRQLVTYEGILDASRHRHNSIWRSVSESNLGLESSDAKVHRSGSSFARKSRNVNDENQVHGRRAPKRGKKSLLPPKVTASCGFHDWSELWSANMDEVIQRNWISSKIASASSFETMESCQNSSDDSAGGSPTTQSGQRSLRNVCWKQMKSGETYSVSRNKVLHLSNTPDEPEEIVRVKDRVSELENCQNTPALTSRSYEDLPEQTGWVQSLANQFEAKNKAADYSQTYCAKVIVRQSSNDPFSSQVDKILEKEERKMTDEVDGPPQISVVTPARPSRRISFGSVDSAIAVGSEIPSRQSSWMSCDTGIVVSSGQPPVAHFPEAPADQDRVRPSQVRALRREEASSHRRSASLPQFNAACLSPKSLVPERKSSLEYLS